MVINKSPVDAVIIGLGWTGSIMGIDPKISALNCYSQHWNYPSLFVMRAGVSFLNIQHNPTAIALTYWAIKAIRAGYLKKFWAAGTSRKDRALNVLAL